MANTANPKLQKADAIDAMPTKTFFVDMLVRDIPLERAVLDLEDLVRALGDGVGDGVAVRGAEHERLEDQQIERALEHLSLQRLASAPRHRSTR